MLYKISIVHLAPVMISFISILGRTNLDSFWQAVYLFIIPWIQDPRLEGSEPGTRQDKPQDPRYPLHRLVIYIGRCL